MITVYDLIQEHKTDISNKKFHLIVVQDQQGKTENYFHVSNIHTTENMENKDNPWLEFDSIKKTILEKIPRHIKLHGHIIKYEEWKSKSKI